MNFKAWLEQDIGKWWASNVPHDYPFIDSEVEKFSESVSNPVTNAILYASIILGDKFNLLKVYGPKEICGNLLNLNSDHIDLAGGYLTDNNKLEKAYVDIDDDYRANLLIVLRPMFYEDSDELLLKGVIIHELRHCADFDEYMNKGGDPHQFDSSRYLEIDINLYARHILEARAHAQQLKYLMKKLNNNVDAVLRLLDRDLAPHQSLHKFIVTFLKEYVKQVRNETYQHHLAAPVVDTDVESQIINLLKKIANAAKFSNNVRKL